METPRAAASENVGHFLLRNLSVTTPWLNRRSLLILPLLAAVQGTVLAPGLVAQATPAKRASYFPAAGFGDGCFLPLWFMFLRGSALPFFLEAVDDGCRRPADALQAGHE